MVAAQVVGSSTTQNREGKPTSAPESGGRHVQLKKQLAGQSYDAQMAMLAPEGAVQKLDAQGPVAAKAEAPKAPGASPKDAADSKAPDAKAPDAKAPDVKAAAEAKAAPDAKAGAAPPDAKADDSEAEIAPPETLTQKSVQAYFNQLFASEFQAKGQFEKFISLKVSKYKSKSKPDKGVTPVTSLGEIWGQVSTGIQALNGDMRTFVNKSVLQTMAPAKGKTPAKEVFITIHTELYRRPVTKAEDKSLSQSMVPVESGLSNNGKQSLAPETYEAFKSLYAAIPAELKAKDPDYGKVDSGFRSSASQEGIWQRALAKNRKEGRTEEQAAAITRKWNAQPGTSAHNTGNAVDMWMGWKMGSSNAKLMQNKNSKLYKQHGAFWEWLKENAPSYGFLPYSPEPWHWEKWK